jgi:hypothetical protein
MVDLNDEDAVREQARYELDRQAMRMLEQTRLNEASAKSARQGNQLVYRPGGEHSFFLDAARRALYGPVDQEREARLRDHAWQLRRHPSFEEVRGLDEAVGQGSTFVPPKYLQSEFTAAAHPLRATADLCRLFEIPQKASSVVIPSFTSGTALQSIPNQNQNQTLSEVDPVDAVNAAPVTTIASKVVVSRQLLDMSSPDSKIDELLSSVLVRGMGRRRIRLC